MSTQFDDDDGGKDDSKSSSDDDVSGSESDPKRSAFKLARGQAVLDPRTESDEEEEANNGPRSKSPPKNVKLKGPSHCEQRRRIHRRAAAILSVKPLGEMAFIGNMDWNVFVEPTLLYLFHLTVVVVFGGYGVMAVVLLTLYILDVDQSLFDGHIAGDRYSIAVILMVLNVVLSVVGCGMTFWIADIERKVHSVRTLAQSLEFSTRDVNEVAQFMQMDAEQILGTFCNVLAV